MKRVLETISGFTNPFSSRVEINELYYLSLSVPAKPKKLLEAQNIGRKPKKDFNDSHFLINMLALTTQLKHFCGLRGQKNEPVHKTKSARNAFGQRVLLMAVMMMMMMRVLR